MPRTVAPVAVPLAALLVAGAGCTMTRQAAAPRATAELRNAQGQPVGTATFAQVGAGVRIVLEARNLPPGDKGVHIHEAGRCEPPGFESAGGHANPGKAQHGLQNPAGPHAGDLPNIAIGPGGTGRLETTTSRMTLGSGPTSLFDADGSALVVHAGPDDHRTDPTGGSGARLACGVIVK
jgi:Cu-Zn family superoxide dismutase